MYRRILKSLKSLNIVNWYRGMSELKLKINVNLLQLLCIVVSVALHGEIERFGGFCVDCITCSNSQHKTHQIAQIRRVEPQKRQHTTIEVGLHLFWALNWPFLDISLRYETLQYSSIHFFIFQTNNQTRRLCGPPLVELSVILWNNNRAPQYFSSLDKTGMRGSGTLSKETLTKLDGFRPAAVTNARTWFKRPRKP